MSILQRRKTGVELSVDIRKLALNDIKATGGLEYTKTTATDLQEAVKETLSQYEDKVGAKNWILRLVQKRLEIET